jgi:hypothetical protein
LKWVAPAGGGGMTSIASGSLSGSSLSLTSISGSYKNLQLVLRDYAHSTNATFKLTANSVTSYTYLQEATNLDSSAASQQVYSNLEETTMFCGFDVALAGDNNNKCIINIYDYADTSSNKVVFINHYLFNSSSENQIVQTTGSINTASALTSLTITTNTGTFSGGTYILYGVN